MRSPGSSGALFSSAFVGRLAADVKFMFWVVSGLLMRQVRGACPSLPSLLPGPGASDVENSAGCVCVLLLGTLILNGQGSENMLGQLAQAGGWGVPGVHSPGHLQRDAASRLVGEW